MRRLADVLYLKGAWIVLPLVMFMGAVILIRETNVGTGTLHLLVPVSRVAAGYAVEGGRQRKRQA